MLIMDLGPLLKLSDPVQESIQVVAICGLVWFFRLHDCQDYVHIAMGPEPPGGAIVVLGAGKRTMFVTMDKDKTGCEAVANKRRLIYDGNDDSLFRISSGPGIYLKME